MPLNTTQLTIYYYYDAITRLGLFFYQPWLLPYSDPNFEMHTTNEKNDFFSRSIWNKACGRTDRISPRFILLLFFCAVGEFVYELHLILFLTSAA
jgi:hypothetical protein